MNKKHIIFLSTLTVCVFLILTCFVLTTISSVNRRTTAASFEDMADAAKHLAVDLYDTTEMDKTILAAMAAIISSEKNITDAELCDILKTYNTSSSYVDYVELLRPDNTILSAGGTVRDVSGQIDFKREAQRGAYVSNIEHSTQPTHERIIRNAMPVVRNGETIYILYGVVRLSDFAEEYKTSLYNGHAYVHLIDGNTGDFMLDTWHKTLGNIRTFSQRKMLPGYSFDVAIDNMKHGISGNLGFVSKTTSNVLYLHYEPVGINNWHVLISVEEKYAMHHSKSISHSLYLMASVIGIVLLLYLIGVSFCLYSAYRQVRRLGSEDQTTGLQNRNAFELFVATNRLKNFEIINCIYIDANGLHNINNRFGHNTGDQMLRTIGEALRSEFSYNCVYRIGGDEFVVITEEGDEDRCKEQMQRVIRKIESHDYHIAHGIVSRRDETGIDRITREADEIMLDNKRRYYETHERRLI